MKKKKEEVETNVVVCTKNHSRISFSFTGDYSLNEYLKRHSVRLGETMFLRVNDYKKSSFTNSDERLINIDSIISIEVTHDIDYE